MRFQQFERDALINYGKKHGYITEGMSDEEINEILPALAGIGRMAAKGAGAVAKGVGKVGAKAAKAGGKLAVKGAKAGAKAAGKLAVKGAKAGAKAAGQGAKAAGRGIAQGAKAVGQAVDAAGGVGAIAQQAGAAVGQGVDKVKGVAQQAAQGFKQQQAQTPAQEIPPGSDQAPIDPKATAKVAQRATALKSVAGGSASGGMVAKGMDKVASGSTLPPNLIKAIAPYTQSIQKMMQDPQLFSKFKLLMKQANAGQ
jgi:hypothetical protein